MIIPKTIDYCWGIHFMWSFKENAKEFKQSIENETLRLISHALLHCAGYTDKDEDEKSLMRIKEDEYIEMFHVKQ